MKIYFIFLALISNIFSSTAPAGPIEITFIAYLDQTPIWNLALKVSEACQFDGFTTVALQHTLKEVKGKECAELSKEVYQVLEEARTRGKSEKLVVHTYASDEPSYVFDVGFKKFQVKFEAPQVCETFPSGDMRCKRNSITSAQRLLISFLAYAHEMKLGI